VLWQRAPVVIKVFCQFIHEYQALVWMNELSHTLFQSCAQDTLILTRSVATVTPQKWTHTLILSTSHKKVTNHIHSFWLCSSINPLSFPDRFLLATYPQDVSRLFTAFHWCVSSNACVSNAEICAEGFAADRSHAVGMFKQWSWSPFTAAAGVCVCVCGVCLKDWETYSLYSDL